MAPLLLICVFLIFLNALFVLMEYALIKVRPSRIEILARRGNPRALAVQDILSQLDSYLAAIQVGITALALALGWMGEPALGQAIRSWLGASDWGLPQKFQSAVAFLLALSILIFSQIVLGELIPRAVGIQKAELIALLGARPLRLFSSALRPVVSFMAFCSVSMLKLLGLRAAAQSESAFSEDEMRILLGETQERGAIPLERLMLLENLFDLGAAKVGEAMVPKDKVVYLSLSKAWPENRETIRAHRFSRYPLCAKGPDTVSGFIHVKDILLKAEGGEPDLESLRRDLVDVAENDSLEKLLKQFPDKGIHMAAVRDEGGGFKGILTLEDIIEELVGEIQDEFDLPRAWSLMDIIVASAVSVQLEASESRFAIAQLVARLSAAEPTLKENEALEAVLTREAKLSSAVGRGVAVPHARLPGLERPLVALGRFAKPVPFSAPDNVPVRLIFLILTPTAAPVVQLKILGRIASLVTNDNLRRRLLRAKTSESVLDILRTADTLLA